MFILIKKKPGARSNAEEEPEHMQFCILNTIID